MRQLQCLLYKNDCYKRGQYISPSRIVVHSTGANNPNLKRYVQPHSAQISGMEEYRPNRKSYTRAEMVKLLGSNPNNNDWNVGGLGVCVNAFIGKLADGSIATVQTLPWKMRPWGCGAGRFGSFNNYAIQFEICEDDTNNRQYCIATFNEAVELCALLCKEYGISPKNIVSHSEAHSMGYASNHGDPEHWWKKHGLSMDKFRASVAALIEPEAEKKQEEDTFLVKVTASVLNVREGAGTEYKVVTTVKKGEVFTIVEEKNGWGKLKSGAGWISLAYTSRK